MKTRQLELTVGLFMSAGMVALFFLAMQVSNLGSLTIDRGYEVTARFDNIGGLKVRSPVSMAGVRIGRVTAIHYDQESYQAVVILRIQSEFNRIPDDSFAKIYTSGLLGEQYVGLDPGSSEESLVDGSEISMTQSALMLEELVGQMIFSAAEAGGEE
jgi:phospholipid/cholesterol/gamma-HCH transport system substrate-binding protein